jgi:hypothetical protein
MKGEGGISRADWIVAAGAVVLAASLFLLDWYAGSLPGLAKTAIPSSDLSSTGWEAFTNSRWVWLVTIVLALATVAAATAGLRRRGEVQSSAVVLLAGAVSSVLVLYRIIHHPGVNLSGKHTQTTYEIKFGIWLGLAAALAITVGGYLQLRAENGPAVPEARLRAGLAAAWANVTARRSSRGERKQGGDELPSEPVFTGLTVRGPQTRPGERRPGRAP